MQVLARFGQDCLSIIINKTYYCPIEKRKIKCKTIFCTTKVYIYTSAKVAILNPKPLTPEETREKCANCFWESHR
jgi:hypothetical protein